MKIKDLYKFALWMLVSALVFFPTLAFFYWFDRFGLNKEYTGYFTGCLAGVAGLIANLVEPKIIRLLNLD